MTRYPIKPNAIGLPHDLCFMRRRAATQDVVLWHFRSEGDLARLNAPTYTLMFDLNNRTWVGDANLMQVRSHDLSPMQVEVLRRLLPPAELAFVTALTLGIGQ